MKSTAFLSACAFTVVAGCASAPPPKYYALGADATTTTRQPTPDTVAPSVSIAAITIPDAVDRPQLVVREGPSEVIIVEQHRWAAPLKRELPRVIAENLSRLLDNPRIAAYPQAAAMATDYRVQLDFQRFEARLGGESTVEVLWTIRTGAGSPVKAGRILVSEAVSGSSPDMLVAAYGRALMRVSMELAKELDGLAPPGP